MMTLAWVEYEADNKMANDEYDGQQAAEAAAAAAEAAAAQGRGKPRLFDAEGRELCRKGLHLMCGDNIREEAGANGKTVRRCYTCRRESMRKRSANARAKNRAATIRRRDVA